MEGLGCFEFVVRRVYWGCFRFVEFMRIKRLKVIELCRRGVVKGV